MFARFYICPIQTDRLIRVANVEIAVDGDGCSTATRDDASHARESVHLLKLEEGEDQGSVGGRTTMYAGTK